MYGADVNQIDGTHTSPLITALTTRRQPRSDSSYLKLIRLLLAAGARLSAAVLERIKVLIVYLQSSASDKEELFLMLTRHTSEPASLQRQCRAAIRQEIRGNVDQKASGLPLPKAVISFVQFSDVPGCVYQQWSVTRCAACWDVSWSVDWAWELWDVGGFFTLLSLVFWHTNYQITVVVIAETNLF